jgi:two-component system cell cycle sensor histidine kinase PleC
MSAEENRFARTLSLAVHEFRTPVAVVAGYLRMLAKEQAGPITEKQRKILEEIERSCGRLTALVGEMSDLGKLEASAMAMASQDVDIAALVAEVASRMHEGHDRGVTLEVRGAERPLVVAGDRLRLSGALGALVHSALRERGEPGVIAVECSSVDEDGGRWAVVAIGAPPLLAPLADARRAQPAFNEWIGGLGLALPLARRIIEAHGGAVWSADGSQSKAASALRLPVRV